MKALILMLIFIGGLLILAGGLLLKGKSLPEPLETVLSNILPIYVLFQAVCEIKRQPAASGLVLGGFFLMLCGFVGIFFL
jgi:hypothetical protein